RCRFVRRKREPAAQRRHVEHLESGAAAVEVNIRGRWRRWGWLSAAALDGDLVWAKPARDRLNPMDDLTTFLGISAANGKVVRHVKRDSDLSDIPRRHGAVRLTSAPRANGNLLSLQLGLRRPPRSPRKPPTPTARQLRGRRPG